MPCGRSKFPNSDKFSTVTVDKYVKKSGRITLSPCCNLICTACTALRQCLKVDQFQYVNLSMRKTKLTHQRDRQFTLACGQVLLGNPHDA